MLKINLILIILVTISVLKYNKILWWQCCAILAIARPCIIFSLCSQFNILSNFSIRDSISTILIRLRIFITSLILLSSIKTLHNKNIVSIFPVLCIILLITLINAFSSNNMFSFYIWFEASLIPTIIIIIIWGYQPERVQASIYIIIYTILASLPMLMIFIIIYITPNSPHLLIFTNTLIISKTINILLIRGFLVKLPIFLTHLWLPKAHVEAPIAGRIILAAILLKLGGYGVYRLIFIFPLNIRNLTTPIMSVSLIGAFLTRIICLRQPDLKSLIAYSSVGHIGLIISGTLSFSTWGMSGTIIIIIAHGLCSSALFSLANINYEITHTRRIFLIKGIIRFLPTITLWWFLFTSINIAAPPSINLLREIILITASISISIFFILFLALLRFITGAYSLNIYGNTQHGNIINYSNPISLPFQGQYLILLAHISPLIILIVIPETMASI